MKIKESIINASRRDFLKSVGIGSSALILGTRFSYPKNAWGNEAISRPELNLFVSISPNNEVSIVCHRSEMGQGIRTSIAQIIADELEAEWTFINVVQADGDKKYGNQNTDGSTSIRNGYTKLRKMGAAARLMLRQAAAKQWNVPLDQCIAKNHQVKHITGQTLSYGELALQASLLEMPDLALLTLKETTEFKYIGRPINLVDGQNIVTGSAEFGQDIRLPNMLYASIERTPVLGGKVASYNRTAPKRVTGVVDVIEIQGVDGPPGFNALAGVAVLGRHTYAAMEGRKVLDVQWTESPNDTHDSIDYLDKLSRAIQMTGDVRRTSGNFVNASTSAARTYEATYTLPYLAHASMEPPSATALIHSDGHCEIWACVQAPQTTRTNVASALGISEDNVTVHVTLLGGAFGRKSKPDFAAEAALLAKSSGHPVKVVWSREDDIQHDYYHAISAQYFKATFDRDNKITGWLARAAYPTIQSTFASADTPQDWELGMALADIPFEIDSIQIEAVAAPSHVRIGWLRSVANIHQSFAVNSFVDELAHFVNRDSKDFMLELIGEDRHVDVNQGGYKYFNYGSDIADYPIDSQRYKHVLIQACDRAKWGKTLPPNEGLGLAVQRSFTSYVAVVTHVAVENNKLEIKQIHCVADCGTIANIDRVHSQMEGAMIFGMSIALMGKISVKDGRVVQSNYDDYPVVRLDQTPDIHVHIVPNSDIPGGVGEPGVPPVMASITNAVYAASGKRIRHLPISDHLNIS